MVNWTTPLHVNERAAHVELRSGGASRLPDRPASGDIGLLKKAGRKDTIGHSLRSHSSLSIYQREQRAASVGPQSSLSEIIHDDDEIISSHSIHVEGNYNPTSNPQYTFLNKIINKRFFRFGSIDMFLITQ